MSKNGKNPCIKYDLNPLKAWILVRDLTAIDVRVAPRQALPARRKAPNSLDGSIDPAFLFKEVFLSRIFLTGVIIKIH